MLEALVSSLSDLEWDRAQEEVTKHIGCVGSCETIDDLLATLRVAIAALQTVMGELEVAEANALELRDEVERERTCKSRA